MSSQFKPAFRIVRTLNGVFYMQMIWLPTLHCISKLMWQAPFFTMGLLRKK